MFTTHGHHIPGSTDLGVRLPADQVAACGGPGVCGTCEAEVLTTDTGHNPEEVANLPYTTGFDDRIEELIQLIVGAYQNTRERSLAITRFEEAGLWLTKCKPADQVKAGSLCQT